MKTAVITTTLTVILVAAILAITAQTRNSRSGPPYPIPPVARVVVCGNRVITEGDIPWIVGVIRSEGCQDIHFVAIDGTYLLAYGTRVEIDAQ